MTYLGMAPAAAPRLFGWVELANWVRHLPATSATMRWAAHRDRERGQGIENRSFGRDAIPVSEFDKWYYGGE